MIKKIEVLESDIDKSVNFISNGDYPGFLEARYVRRCQRYFIAYLSSQTGCKQACRFCHLTATGQTQLVDTTPDGFLEQAIQVFDWYKRSEEPAEIVHYGFMARGEALVNQYITTPGNCDILARLAELANSHGLFPRFNISTIMPIGLRGKKFHQIFNPVLPDIYYSIYTTQPAFRKRWLPNAMPVEEALDLLADWQQLSKKIIKLHWCFIEGENDSHTDLAGIAQEVLKRDLRVDVNIVRYNPFSERLGTEPPEEVVKRNVDMLQAYLPYSKIDLIERVGPDVHASCGMFPDR